MPKFTLTVKRLAEGPEEIDLSVSDISRIVILVERYIEWLKENELDGAAEYQALLEKLKRCF